jgi:hypothetical protein
MEEGNAYSREQIRFIDAVIEEIDGWPAELRAFDSQYESFGSWQLILRRKGVRVRFTYDGRDSYLHAERLQPDSGDFSKPPKNLGGISLPRELPIDILPQVLGFIRQHAG